MIARLLAGRFENNDNTADLLERFAYIEDVGIRWNINTSFGLERMEVTVKTRNKYDLYSRQRAHLGQRFAVFSHWATRPISGNIVRVEPAGAGRVTYIVRGPGWRHEDQLVRTTFPVGQDTDERLKQLLTNYVDVTSSDYSDIDATGKDAAEFQTEWPRGNYPSDIIQAYRQMSDASSNPWDYYCIDEAFNGTSLRMFKPYFKNRNAQPVRWRVRRKDMREPKMAPSIEELKSFVRVWYGSFEATVTTADATGQTLTDSGANFTGFQVQAGDKVVNITDGSRGKVESVTSGSVLVLVGTGLQGGTDDRFDIGDDIVIERQDAWYSATATNPTAPLTRHFDHNDKRFRFEQAQSYADALIDFYGAAVQQSPFVITAPFIRDQVGARWPLWEVIAQGGGVIQVSDLYPAALQFQGGLDTDTTFFITAMDYSLGNNQLTIHVDSEDGRLDAKLHMLGITGGEIISG